MASHKTSKIKQALLDKGFVEAKTHHSMFWYCLDGKKTSLRTRISHGYKEYGDGLLGQMARQVGLDRNQLNDLIECPLSAEAYQNILIAQGLVKP